MRKNIPDANNSPDSGAVRQTKTTLQKQGIFIIVVASLLVLFLIFYFAILPLLQKQTATIDYVYPGEHLDSSGTVLYMVTPLERAQISKIEIKNEHGTYVLNESGYGASKKFVLEGAEKTVLDDYSVSGIVVAAGQPITSPADSKNYRANERATEADLARYGLDAASDPNWFRVTRSDGTSYKIVFGDKIPAGSGCYAYVDDPSRMNVVTEDGVTSEYYIVYVLDKTSYNALVYGKTALVNTLVGTSYLGNGAYYTKNFEIYRYEDGERKLKIDIEESDTVISGATQFDLIYPGGYNVNSDVFINNVLATVVYFQATKVEEIGNEIFTPEVYEKYGLDLDKERLEAGTDKNHKKFTIESLDANSKDASVTIYVSEKKLLADGKECYYAYLPEQLEIVELSAETFAWLDWDFGAYVDLRMFFEYIGSLDYFSVLSADKTTDVRFTLTGNPYNHHVKVTDSTGTTVLVDPDTGKDIVFDVEWETGIVKPTFNGSFENFRALYYVLITRMLDGSEEPIKISDDAECVLTVVAQSIQRDRNEQFYKYVADGEYEKDENGKNQTVIYEGGYVLVQNLKGVNKDGITLTYDKAFFDEKTGKYFVKAVDSADGNEKPRSFEYTEDGKLVPQYLSITNTTAEYTLKTFEYKFYDLHNDDGSVNQTYMLVVPTTTTSVWRIETDGTRTLVSSETTENDNMASYIRRASVEKLVSDTGKALAGIEIDEWGVD